MEKFTKSDIIVTIILIGSWLFYFMYDGTTRFDINQTVTLPLLGAADFTGISILYAMGRYYAARKGNIVSAALNNLVKDEPVGQTQDSAESEDNKP